MPFCSSVWAADVHPVGVPFAEVCLPPRQSVRRRRFDGASRDAFAGLAQGGQGRPLAFFARPKPPPDSRRCAAFREGGSRLQPDEFGRRRRGGTGTQKILTTGRDFRTFGVRGASSEGRIRVWDRLAFPFDLETPP